MLRTQWQSCPSYERHTGHSPGIGTISFVITTGALGKGWALQEERKVIESRSWTAALEAPQLSDDHTGYDQ